LGCQKGNSSGSWYPKRDRGKSREDPGNTNNGEANKTARHSKAHRTRHGSKSICGTARGKITSLLCTDEKKSDDKFEWTEEADIAFTQLKKVLATPPVLVAPKEKEPLLLYIAATHQMVSTVLVVKRSEEGKTHGVQRPVYFVSEVLSPTKQRYPHYQKLAYSVFTSA
jgi:hypothetical protein